MPPEQLADQRDDQVVGAGLGRKGGEIDWRVVRGMGLASAATLPAAGLMGASAEALVAALPGRSAGVVLVAAIAAATVSVIAVRSRRDGVNAHNVIEAVAIEEPAPPPTLVAA